MIFETFGRYLITIIEIIGAIAIGYGALQTLWRTLSTLLKRKIYSYPEIRLNFTRYLLLGLEFELGADIIASIIVPSFIDIGRLAAIAAIRTAISFFLDKELDKVGRRMGKIEIKL